MGLKSASLCQQDGLFWNIPFLSILGPWYVNSSQHKLQLIDANLIFPSFSLLVTFFKVYLGAREVALACYLDSDSD